MTDHHDPDPTHDEDAVLAAAGARLRARSRPLDAATVEAAVWRRRNRRVTALAAAALVAVALLGGLLVVGRGSDDEPAPEVAADLPGRPTPAKVDRLLSSLPSKPVDPTKVRLVRDVSTFADCDALVGDLRRVGAQHVGSRGFGASYGYGDGMGYGATMTRSAATFDAVGATATGAATGEGVTLGTNVQVTGVDELDHVKAVGKLIFDLDGRGNLRITDSVALQVLATLDVTPPGPSPKETGDSRVDELLVSDGRVVIFGSEVEVSKPVAGDPSATRASTSYLTATFVDATDPAKPTITDRVRVEGSLVSARLVAGEVRLVTTANMADLGFVVPTTPNSVPKALEQNRRSVATSNAPDWIPDWQRSGSDPEPLVPCDRVHVPDTFSGVAMTSMVTFPVGSGRFQPAGTSILAPATTLYAGLDTVAISSEVWVDPVDRDRLEFDDWQTAVHEFTFAEGAAPDYAGSGIVDGSTIGQFAFGEVGDSLAVVTTKGTPWKQDAKKLGVDLTILTPDGDGGLDVASKVADLSDGRGEVTAVRFLDGRVVISTGLFGRQVLVIDVTEPDAPRRAGAVTLPSTVGYFHPLADQRALVIGSRSDTVDTGKQKQTRSWVVAQLLDVADADAPKVLSSWERPWTADELASDHHAFTYWPDRELAMWGLQGTRYGGDEQPNEAAVLRTDGSVTEVAVPVAHQPNEVPPPCPAVEVTDEQARELVGDDGIVLRCGDVGRKAVEWPRYRCFLVDKGTIARFAPGQQDEAAFFACSPAPLPRVSRVLVVAGRPMLLTDQTLEVLDPETFASTSITYFPSGNADGYAY